MMKTLNFARSLPLAVLFGLSCQAFAAQVKAPQAPASRGDIEITGMDTDIACSDLDITYSKRRGEIYLRFDDAFTHSTDDGYKSHCLVDLYVYVPEGLRFSTRNLAIAGSVATDDSTAAAVATSFRSIGKAGPVITDRFEPGEQRDFYLESRGDIIKADRDPSQARRCTGYSMTLRLRVDLMLEEDTAKRQLKAKAGGKDSAIQVDSAALRYRATRC